MKLIYILLALLLAVPCFAQDEFPPEWDEITVALWPTFQRHHEMVDNCALKLAHGLPFDTYSEWPAYCNAYRDTELVQTRTEELKREIAAVKSKKARSNIAKGLAWIGATSKQAELAWGRPKRVHRSINARGTREQWVYQGGNYLYLDNGRVSSIQN